MHDETSSGPEHAPRGLLLLEASRPLPSCSSTQELCARLAATGAPEGTVVRAAEQTAGRGRFSRNWHSPPGLGLWMSFLLRPRVDPAHWPGLTALAALAAAETIESLPGRPAGEPGWRASIRWPNDIYGIRGKISGILADVAGGGVVVGIGINLGQEVADFPPGLRNPASSLRIEGFDPVADPEEAAHAFDARLAPAYARFVAGERAFLQEGLRARFHLRGASLRIEGPAWAVEGIATDVGPEGELILETRDGPRTITSGEVVSARSAGLTRAVDPTEPPLPE